MVILAHVQHGFPTPMDHEQGPMLAAQTQIVCTRVCTIAPARSILRGIALRTINRMPLRQAFPQIANSIITRFFHFFFSNKAGEEKKSSARCMDDSVADAGVRRAETGGGLSKASTRVDQPG